jgi:hypothetical protein
LTVDFYLAKRKRSLQEIQEENMKEEIHPQFFLWEK